MSGMWVYGGVLGVYGVGVIVVWDGGLLFVCVGVGGWVVGVVVDEVG